MERLPAELVEFICEYLEPKSLFQLCLTCRKLHLSCIPALWKMIKIGPKITLDVWYRFVDFMCSPDSQKYRNLISNVDDLWLFIGAEKVDSAINVEFPVGMPRYSLGHILQVLLLSTSLRSLKLNFFFDKLGELPWQHIQNLRSLTLEMRITDNSLAKIIQSNLNLKSLKLTRAEISDSSLLLISKYCPRLTQIRVNIVPLYGRSRYHVMQEPSALLEVTDIGFCSLKTLPLTVLDIHPLTNVSIDAYSLFTQPKEVSITLSHRKSISAQVIVLWLSKVQSLIKVNIYGDKKINAHIVEKVFPEECLHVLPKKLPRLQSIFLHQIDFSRIENGLLRYFGPIEMDYILQDFQNEFPSIKLNVQRE